MGHSTIGFRFRLPLQLNPKKYFINDRNKYKQVTNDPETGNETTIVSTNGCSKKDDHYSVGLIAQERLWMFNAITGHVLALTSENYKAITY